VKKEFELLPLDGYATIYRGASQFTRSPPVASVMRHIYQPIKSQMSPIFLGACLVAAVLIPAIVSSSKKRQPQQDRLETVKCKTCNCLLLEADSVKVKNGGYVNFEIEHYCLIHKPPYDEIIYEEYYKVVPAHKIQVTEDGKEIKKRERSA